MPGRWKLMLTVYPILIVLGLIMVTPLIWMVVTAFKSTGQVLNLAAPIIPAPWHWNNLIRAWDAAPFGRFYLNSVIYTVSTTAGQILISAMAGYAFARGRFPGREILFYAVLASLMIPFTVIMVPVVKIVENLGWFNTYQGLIIPRLSSAFGIFLFRQFFISMPTELDDAAHLDGASGFRVFWTINLPLAQPMLAAFGMLAFLVNWHDFLYPLLVTSSTRMMVLPLGLEIFRSAYATQYNLLMAGAFIAIIPVLIVSLFAQRRIVEGISMGAFK